MEEGGEGRIQGEKNGDFEKAREGTWVTKEVARPEVLEVRSL